MAQRCLGPRLDSRRERSFHGPREFPLGCLDARLELLDELQSPALALEKLEAVHLGRDSLKKPRVIVVFSTLATAFAPDFNPRGPSAAASLLRRKRERPGPESNISPPVSALLQHFILTCPPWKGIT